MSSSDLIRWAGLTAMLGGVAFIVMTLLGLAIPESAWTDVVFIVALLLVLVGLSGFHTLQKGSYGRVGRAGFYTVIVASLAQILGLVVLLAGSTALEWLIFPVGLLGVVVGFVLYGAATLQARVLPRWCGVGLIVGLPVWIVLGEYGVILFGLLWLALGYTLWSRSGAAVERPARVS
ncbi:MAG: hypothetical protein M3426_00610 [Actinomycetota bacterium]|nr:hypothetical protein [Actinomycetota bacterium]